jgi:hypothetical protein
VKKTVIFVGGSSYSGTTMLDLTLGNDPNGFSCGEVQNYALPSKAHHLNLNCSCGDRRCALWTAALRRAPDRIYETIFQLRPEVKFIVDSSKNPFWIRSQQNSLEQQGITVRNLLIWKSPLQIAQSYKKRNNLDAWEQTWINYHRLYSSVIADWFAVSYESYISEHALLESVCDKLEIPYFDEKPMYWNKAHHVLGGNHSARIHLHDPNTQEFERSRKVLSRDTGDDGRHGHRDVSSHSADDRELRDQVARRLKESPYLAAIVKMLTARDVAAYRPDAEIETTVRLPGSDLIKRRALRGIRLLSNRMRYGWRSAASAGAD